LTVKGAAMAVDTLPVLERNARPDSNAKLVQECLRGKQEAWNELIDRYKNLIYSIPNKYGLSRDEAADIFQAVCME
jgi:hypothetical protein